MDGNTFWRRYGDAKWCFSMTICQTMRPGVETATMVHSLKDCGSRAGRRKLQSFRLMQRRAGSPARQAMNLLPPGHLAAKAFAGASCENEAAAQGLPPRLCLLLPSSWGALLKQGRGMQERARRHGKAQLAPSMPPGCWKARPKSSLCGP